MTVLPLYLRFGHLSLKKWLFYSCWTHQPLGRLSPRTITVYLQRPGVARVVHWPDRWTSSEQLTIWTVRDLSQRILKRVRAFIELPWGIKNRTQYHGRAAQMADGHQTVNLTHKKLRGFESLLSHKKFQNSFEFIFVQYYNWIVMFFDILICNLNAGVLELVDKRDLNSLGQWCPCGFDSHPLYQKR